MLIRLILDIHVDLKNENIETIKEIIGRIPKHAYAEGLMTGDTEAEVDDWHANVIVVDE